MQSANAECKRRMRGCEDARMRGCEDARMQTREQIWDRAVTDTPPVARLLIGPWVWWQRAVEVGCGCWPRRLAVVSRGGWLWWLAVVVVVVVVVEIADTMAGLCGLDGAGRSGVGRKALVCILLLAALTACYSLLT